MYKKDLEFDKKKKPLNFLEKPKKKPEVCRCYLGILIPIISYLGMKHSIQDLKQELRPASPPSTLLDRNPFEYFQITLKLSQLSCTFAFSYRA